MFSQIPLIALDIPLIIYELDFEIIELGEVLPHHDQAAVLVSLHHRFSSPQVLLNPRIELVGLVLLGSIRLHSDVMNRPWGSRLAVD